MTPEELQSKLAPWLVGEALSDSVALLDMKKLSGGAIQENWALDAQFSSGPLAGRHELVVRTDAPASVSVSHSRAEEFVLLKLAFDAGVTVPEPLFGCEDESILGRPFFVMRRVAGVAAGFRLVRSSTLGGDRQELLKRLGHELALIHSITPPDDALSFLAVPDNTPAARDIAQSRAYLDEFSAPRPILEWGLTWLERNAPPACDLVLSHQDFRTGNYMVDEAGLTGILDWEFSAWGDPMSDIGWFCAKCWRFGANDNEAGGMGSREDFYRAYEEKSERSVDAATVHWWEVMAHVRWAVIAVQQGDRFVVDGEENLEAALTAYVVPELELEVMRMTGETP